MRRCGVDVSVRAPMVASSENGNEPLGSIRGGEFLD